MKNSKSFFQLPGFKLMAIFFAVIIILFPACQSDEIISCDEITWYEDADGDGLGNPASSILDCDQPIGYVANNNDNNDNVIDDGAGGNNNGNGNDPTDLSSVAAAFGDAVNLNNLMNYASQPIPNYIDEDNTPGNNAITDAGATLGRILFYDKNLSVDNTISCASCHKQELGFGDDNLQSTGVDGLTGRHAMRLVNARFSEERRFFWDERANSLEQQTTMPIQDHIEMGFSGQNGDPSINDLIEKLEGIGYYQELFEFVYGDAQITEQRMQRAMAQFVRSIQSFDSKYDQGRSQVNNNNAQFPNFTQQENQGKNLFMQNNGAACNRCHQAPEFGIDNNTNNNGVVGVIGDPNAIDVSITRSPSLRDIFNPSGQLNGSLMHDGSMTTMLDVINHYNDIPIVPGNNNLDNRLRGGGPGGGGNNGNGQNLNLSEQEKQALIAFLRTLGGTNVYTDERWSDPFEN